MPKGKKTTIHTKNKKDNKKRGIKGKKCAKLEICAPSEYDHDATTTSTAENGLILSSECDIDPESTSEKIGPCVLDLLLSSLSQNAKVQLETEEQMNNLVATVQQILPKSEDTGKNVSPMHLYFNASGQCRFCVLIGGNAAATVFIDLKGKSQHLQKVHKENRCFHSAIIVMMSR